MHIQNKEQNSKNAPTKDEVDLNNESNIMNYLFSFLILICFTGTAFLILNLETYWSSRISYMPENYKLPQLTDFKIVLIALPILCLFKYTFLRFVEPFMYKYVLSMKYKDESNTQNFSLGFTYSKKLTINFLKAIYYTFSSIFAYTVSKNLIFMPIELFGNGDMQNIFINGIPNYIFWEKPLYFDIYYLTALSYTLTDLIWLLFIYEKQTDFILMLLHHSITISLVVFSFLTNFSQIGIIVFFLHDLTDIVVYLTRIIINTDFVEWFKFTFCAFFLFSYIYLRIYVFGKLIYTVAINVDLTVPSVTLMLFKCILMIMHIYWVFEILKRFWYFKIDDVGKVKKKK